jgi:hypothetical protein
VALVTAVTINVVPSSLIPFALSMEAIHSSETSVLTRATWRHVEEDGILHTHGRQNLKSHMEINLLGKQEGNSAEKFKYVVYCMLYVTYIVY